MHRPFDQIFLEAPERQPQIPNRDSENRMTIERDDEKTPDRPLERGPEKAVDKGVDKAADKAPDRAKERKERAQARARKDILEAALRAFAASGYRNTKMADIASEAGYTAASLYTYFASKRDIIHELADMLVDEIVQAWGPVPEPTTRATDFVTFAGRLRERVRGVLAHLDRRSEGLAFFLRLRWAGDPDLDLSDAAVEPCVAEDRHENKIRQRLEQVLVGMGIRQVSTLEPEVVSSAIGGMVETLVLRGIATGSMPRFIDEAERITTFLLYGIRGER